jgi:hypothetical protein
MRCCAVPPSPVRVEWSNTLLSPLADSVFQEAQFSCGATASWFETRALRAPHHEGLAQQESLPDLILRSGVFAASRRMRPHKLAVIPRACGVSSTQRLLGSITNVSGILDRPLSRTMTTERVARNFAIPRRDTPGSLSETLRPFRKEGAGKAGCWLAPAVSCARCAKRCAHEHTGSSRNNRPSLRNGLTAYAALSPATNSSCHRHRRIDGLARSVELAKPPPT